MRRTLVFVIVGGVLLCSLLGAGWILNSGGVSEAPILPGETTDWTQDRGEESAEVIDSDTQGLPVTVENQTLRVENPNDTPATVTIHQDGVRILTFGVPPGSERTRQLVEGSYTLTAQINETSVPVNGEDRTAIDIESWDLDLDVTIDERDVHIENPGGTDVIVTAIHDETGDTRAFSVPAESTRSWPLEPGDYTLTGESPGASVSLDGQEALPISTSQSTTPLHVRIVDVTSPVDVGGSLSVTAEISNDGPAETEGDITLDIDDRAGLDSTTVALDPDETETVTLEYLTTEDDIGDRTFRVRSPSDTADVTVEVLEGSTEGVEGGDGAGGIGGSGGQPDSSAGGGAGGVDDEEAGGEGDEADDEADGRAGGTGADDETDDKRHNEGADEVGGEKADDDGTDDETDGAEAPDDETDNEIDDDATGEVDDRSIDSCMLITESGTYELTDDIERKGEVVDDEHDDACIRITASDVVLDGNDNTVIGASDVDYPPATIGVLVSGTEETPAENVTIRNLRAEGWDPGIRIGNRGDRGEAHIENVVVSDNNGAGIYLRYAGTVSIESVEANRNGGSGISTTEGTIESLVDVTANENAGAGVFVGEETIDSMVDITANDNRGSGIDLFKTRGVTAEQITVSGNGRDGIHFSMDVYETEFSEVYASDNDGSGIFMTADSSRNVIRDATIENNGGPGIGYVENDGNEFHDVTVRNNEGRQVDSKSSGDFSASALQIGDTAEFAIDEEIVSFDDIDRDELPELPDGARAVGAGVEVDGIENSVDLTLEYDETDAAEGQIELWRHDGDEWTSEETVDDEAEGQIESTLTDDGLYAPVLVEENESAGG